MKRISPIRYITNNKKKTMVLLIIISIAVFCISTIMTLVTSVYKTSEKVSVDVFNYFSIINSPSEIAREWLLNDTINLECYQVKVTTTSISTVLGTTSSYIISVEDGKMQEMFDKLNLNIYTGSMPKSGCKQIIINENIAKNKKLQEGDYLGDFIVSGIFEGDIQTSFCYMSDYTSLYGDYSPLSYLVLPKESANIDTVNEECNKYKEEMNIITKDSQKSNLDEEFETINLIMNIIVILVSICLSIAVSAFVYTSYTNRNEEFAIYYAIGYGINNIVRLIIEETVFISIVAYILGNFLSIIILKIIDWKVYNPLGQRMEVLSLNNLGFTLIIPILVIIFSCFPVVCKLTKTDLLMLIERR